MSTQSTRLVAALMGALVLGSTMGACGAEDPNQVAAPAAAKELKGKPHAEVEDQLERAGFTNVETEVREDLVTGWLTKDGEVEHVTIAGQDDYAKGKKYAPDAKVVVVYHTFPKTDEETAQSSTPAPQATAADEASSTGEESEGTITAKNNPELAKLLELKDPAAPEVAAFAEKYKGQRIEFDGAILALNPHGSYKTRFDFLVGAGDFDPNASKGPNFQFDDVNAFDLNIAGSEDSSSLEVGQNLHVIAEVGEYKEFQELFILEPVETRLR
ncbi:DUF4839 domain-containing protein [Luteococcus sp. Sow4_B9]|uniref:DUF4839 domain-containing protein n=1 Tax=Luteococcus sp. Sow4_B9 TaxID=3438792 RepID=UPI003F9911EA